MTWKVTAPLVLAVNPDGQVDHVYSGGIIDWLSDEQKAHFLAEGLVVDIDRPQSGAEDAPHAAATKSELIAWLVEHAVRDDGGEYTAGALQPLNKDELRALIEAVD